MEQPVPVDAKLAGTVTSVTRDSENAWIFSTAVQDKDGMRPGLTRYDGVTRETFADRDEFSSKLAHKGARYRVGSPLNPWYPVFDDRGRSISSHAGQHVKYYDGQSWLTSPQVPEGSLHGRHPFFRGNDVVVVGKAGTYKAEIDAETLAWTWKSTEPVPYPFPETVHAHPSTSTPANVPLDDTQRSASISIGMFTATLGNGKLAMHDGHAWHAIPTANTPIANWPTIDGATWAPPNRFIFQSDQLQHKTVILITPSIRLTTKKPHLGRFDKPHAIARPEFESDVSADKLVLYYRIDDGIPAPITADGSANLGLHERGVHRLTLMAMAKETLSVSEPAMFEFETTYDMGEHIAPLVRQLGDEAHATREAATQVLIGYGKPVVPYMKPLVKHDDPEIATRAGRIISAVTRSKP